MTKKEIQQIAKILMGAENVLLDLPPDWQEELAEQEDVDVLYIADTIDKVLDFLKIKQMV